jgi:hypothetical protein
VSLFPDKDVLAREIGSWSGFGDSLRVEDRALFDRMLGECHARAVAINAKGEPFTAEALLMALVLAQHKTIAMLLEVAREKKHERLDL